MKEWYNMPIIRGIKDFNWNLSREDFKCILHLIKSPFTGEKKLEKWVYLYAFILVPLLDWGIIMLKIEILIPESSIKWVYSPINLVLMSILIAFTILTFTLSLSLFKRIRPFLFTLLFTQILILFFEIHIIRIYYLSYHNTKELSYLFSFLCSLSLLFIIIQLLKMIYLRIRAKVILRRELTKLSV